MMPKLSRRGFLAAVFATPVLVALRPAPVNLSVPMAWSAAAFPLDKEAIIRKMLDDAIAAHDDLIEEALFAAGASWYGGAPWHPSALLVNRDA